MFNRWTPPNFQKKQIGIGPDGSPIFDDQEAPQPGQPGSPSLQTVGSPGPNTAVLPPAGQLPGGGVGAPRTSSAPVPTVSSPGPSLPTPPRGTLPSPVINPTNARPNSLGPQTAASTPGSQRVDPDTATQNRNATIFDPADPSTALRAALREQGLSPLSMNPTMRRILSMAQGLAASFLIQGSAGRWGNDASVINQQGGISKFFHDFLTEAIQGHGPGQPAGGAGIASALYNPQGNGSTAFDAMRGLSANLDAYTRAGLGNADVSNMNPFTSYVSDLFGSNRQAAPGMISNLLAPGLGSFGRAYSQGVANANDVAWENQDYSDPTNSNPFQYLLGLRR